MEQRKIDRIRELVGGISYPRCEPFVGVPKQINSKTKCVMIGPVTPDINEDGTFQYMALMGVDGDERAEQSWRDAKFFCDAPLIILYLLDEIEHLQLRSNS